jgi:hypothetical protein
MGVSVDAKIHPVLFTRGQSRGSPSPGALTRTDVSAT